MLTSFTASELYGKRVYCSHTEPATDADKAIYDSYDSIFDVPAYAVYIDTAKTEIKVGEELLIDGYALDDYGVDSYAKYTYGQGKAGERLTVTDITGCNR